MVAVSLCVIARDEEPLLEGCLESARSLVDEMIVVDTGSQDQTAALARRLGARVFHHPWSDDFAAARNHALRQARGDWVLCLDADERLQPTGDDGGLGVELRQAPERQLARAVPLRPHPGWTECRAFRLFRNRREITFSGRVHETIRPALARLVHLPGPLSPFPGDVVGDCTSCAIEHLDLDPQVRERKSQRNLPLLEAELAADPRQPLVRNDLAAQYLRQGDRPRALALLEDGIGEIRSCVHAVSPIAACLYLRKAEIEARPESHGSGSGPEATLLEGLSRFPATLQLIVQLAEHSLRQRQLQQALQYFAEAVELVRSDRYDRDLSMPRTCVDRRPLEGLANTSWILGDRQAAEQLFTELVQLHPGELAFRATLEVIAYLRSRR